MIDEWSYLIARYTIQGARSKFEDVCSSLFKKKFPFDFVKSVKVKTGDGGVDIFIGDIDQYPIHVVQCKFFSNGLGQSQKGQIRDSFKTAIGSSDFKMSKWTLCIADELTIDEHKWWANWKNKQNKIYGLPNNFIELIDGSDLSDDLKEYKLYDDVFELDSKKAIDEIHKAVVGGDINIHEEFLAASSYIKNLKNYFSKVRETHLQRKETDKIITWVKNDLPGKNSLEKVFIVKGKKGMGKTTILHDVYCKLLTENGYYVLAIKCDQFYDVNLDGLTKQLFNSVTSFQRLISTIATSGQKFIVILDQLDALSQTLSSDRRWLQTYIKLIYDLMNLSNARIIVSTRSFDLEYDADLRRFNDNQHTKQIEIGAFSKTEVTDILKLLKIEAKNDLLTELLTVPYNLELFTKIPSLENLLKKDARISLTKLYSELWSQVLTVKQLKLVQCLNAIVKRMYELHPNLIDQAYLEEFQAEIDYLISHNILLKNGNKLSFFHQSFYEYYLARWFVVSDKDLIEYIFEEGQNLYIRSLIKTVIDYLREANHQKYIELYNKVINNKQVRFHIKYLFVLELGLIEIPSQKEKELVGEILPGEYGKLFLDLFSSGGWVEFLIANDLLVGDTNEIYRILYRNVNHHPKLILNYLEESNLGERDKFIEGMIPNINYWNNDLIPFFEKYYRYNAHTELWYFETLKKISSFNLHFVFEKLKPAILATQSRNERLIFNHRFDGIIELLYQQNAKETTNLLFSIHLEVLEDTKHPYYSDYSDINSKLVSSLHYDNGLRYKESRDEKSIDFFLLKYYSECDKNELGQLTKLYSNTNYVSLLILLSKLLRDRASDFVQEIYNLILIIEAKNGLKQVDDFFQLNIRQLIAKSIIYFTPLQYQKIKGILLNITHPYEIWKYNDRGKRKFNLNIGRKKYLFLRAIPFHIVQKDPELLSSYQVLERRFGEIDQNLAFDRNNSRFGAVGSPLSNANFEKFGFEAWLKSMRKINEDYKSDDFFKGGLLEHARSFESVVEKRPDHFFDFINRLFDEKGVSYSYISHGISALIKAKYDSAKVANLVSMELKLPLNREYTQYAIWHTDYLIRNGKVTDGVVEFLISASKSGTNHNDVFNPSDPAFDFINTPRGSSIYHLMRLFNYPQYKDKVFEAVESAINPQNTPSMTILAGVMSQVAYLNHLDVERAFLIFKQLVLIKNPTVLKYSINSAQYFNNRFHDEMRFYFDEMLLHSELHDKCYFFVSSWIFEDIDDHQLYDSFMKLGENAIKCALSVAEDFLIKDENINNRAMDILKQCVKTNFDISHELAGLILRKFKIENFNQLLEFISMYTKSDHFINDPRYCLEFLTECTSVYPKECLNLIKEMKIPLEVDISRKAYLGDEPLVLVLSLYSRLRVEPFKYRQEQQTALDIFDKLLNIPSIRFKALHAMESVLN